MAANPGEDPASASGMFKSLSRISGTLLGIVHTRLELLRTELQEEVQYAAKLALWGFVAAFAGLIALFMGALTVVFAFWDTHRLAASLTMVGLFVVIAVAAALITAQKLRTKPPMLDATLAELAKDRDQLRSRL
jgi:uncharacterized membrane protein YqjE